MHDTARKYIRGFFGGGLAYVVTVVVVAALAILAVAWLGRARTGDRRSSSGELVPLADPGGQPHARADRDVRGVELGAAAGGSGGALGAARGRQAAGALKVDDAALNTGSYQDAAGALAWAVAGAEMLRVSWPSGEQYPRPDEVVTIRWKGKKVMRCGPKGCVSLLPVPFQGPKTALAPPPQPKTEPLKPGDKYRLGCNTCVYDGWGSTCTLLACSSDGSFFLTGSHERE